MKIFETHAHYDDEAFREDREALFDEMFANDIDTIINVGASFAGCEQSVALADSASRRPCPPCGSWNPPGRCGRINGSTHGVVKKDGIGKSKSACNR